MMCQRIGRPPTSTIGLGRYSVSSRNRVPKPPHKIITCIIVEKSLNWLLSDMKPVSVNHRGGHLQSAHQRKFCPILAA
jgi:hypothetical protein